MCVLKRFSVAIFFVICGVVLLSLSPTRGQAAIRLLGVQEMRETARGAIPFPCDSRYSWWWCDDWYAYCRVPQSACNGQYCTGCDFNSKYEAECYEDKP
jgi:hypothetical protein